MNKPQEYASVWDAIADTPEQAANFHARAELVRSIASIVKRQGWTQTAAARRCGVTQPRMNDLLRGRISRFSLDALVNIAARLGRVQVKIKAASTRFAGTQLVANSAGTVHPHAHLCNPIYA